MICCRTVTEKGKNVEESSKNRKLDDIRANRKRKMGQLKICIRK